MSHVEIESQEIGKTLRNAFSGFKADVLIASQMPPIQGIIRAEENNGYDIEGNSTLEQWKYRLTHIFSRFSAQRNLNVKIFYVDEKGQVQASSGVSRDAKGSVKKHSYFQTGLQFVRNNTYLVPIDLKQPIASQVLRFIAPVFNQKGAHRGLVILEIPLLSFLEDFRLGAKKWGEKHFIVDSNLVYSLDSDPKEKWTTLEKVDTSHNLQQDFPEMGKAVLNNGSKVGIYGNFAAGITEIRSSDSANAPAITFIAANDMDVFLKPYYQKRQQLIFIGIVLLLFVGLISYLLTRSLIKPIQILTKSSRKIASGNYSARTKIISKDEIGELAGNFNDMAAKIESVNYLLEEKVRKRTEQLQKSSRQLERLMLSQNLLLTSASHYLRTPLNILSGFLTMLRQTQITPEQEEHVNKLELAGQEMLHQVEKMFNLSQLKSDKKEVLEIEFDLKNILDPLLAEYKKILDLKSVRLKTQISHMEQTQYIGDPQIIQEICAYMIENAGKYTRKDKTLSVRIFLENSVHSKIDFHIETSNEASELSREYYSRYFLNQKEIDPEHDEVPKSGFGLYLIELLVKKINGQFFYEYDKESGQNKFRVVVPLRQV